jgi:hypothetical protein
VSGYGLDEREIEVRSPAEAGDFSCSLCVQTGSGVHLSSCTMRTGRPFPGAKDGRCVTLTTHLYLVPRSRMCISYISSPQSSFKPRSGTELAFFSFIYTVYRRYFKAIFLGSCYLVFWVVMPRRFLSRYQCFERNTAFIFRAEGNILFQNFGICGITTNWTNIDFITLRI